MRVSITRSDRPYSAAMTDSRRTRFLVPVTARDAAEPHRTASPLELFFDLVFVIAVSIAAGELHHALTEGHVGHGLVSYGLVFFGIWWAWMNFTWFATSFDTDDWLYRLLTFVQMGGVLVLAAGIHAAFTEDEFELVVLGYVVMRIALVSQWLRASRSAGQLRRTTLTYAGGVALMQLLWVGFLAVPDQWKLPTFLILVVGEIAVPVAAERRANTPWHPHHITERYGCFTLILLGESLLASSRAIIEAFNDDSADHGSLIVIAILAFTVTAGLWWIYFWPPHHAAIGSLRQSLIYGYGHYVVFAAAGAFSAGVEVEIDRLAGQSHLGEVAASFTVTVPVAVFILGIWLIAIRRVGDPVVNTAIPVCAAVVLLDPILPVAITVTALAVAVLVAVLVARQPSGFEEAQDAS